MLLKLEQWTDRFSDLIGYLAGGLMVLMMINVFLDAIMRYFFRTGSIALQEMEWHLFSIVFLFGIAYGLKEDGHVRVDLIYDRLGPKAKAAINIAGTFLFLLPLAFLIIQGSLPFVAEAYNMQEISGDPGGLTHRWLIKAVIPTAFVFLMVSTLGFLVRNINILRGVATLHQPRVEDEIL
ncbi:MAG: TRAP transporter small permease subunit [Gammaproteobacteria bacterium]|nr:TRAP transporter small permease subunit [Gammaproteobacteria bacterium]